MGKGYVDKRLGMYRDAGGAGSDTVNWDSLRAWIENNYPYIETPIDWDEFITKFGDDLSTWLENNYPYINDPIDWDTWINNHGDDLSTWLTTNFPNITTGDTFEEFVSNFGDELKTWLTQNFPTIDNPITWADFITNFGDDLKTWLDANYTLSAGDWNDFITNFGNELKTWLTENFPFIDETVTWEDFITTYGNDLRSWLTENYPAIEGDTWEEFITNFGDDLTTWLTENYPTNEGATWEEFINNLGDELHTWITQEFPYIDNTQEWEEFITNVLNRYLLDGKYTRLISGTVTHLQDLDFLISPLVYQILGIRYSSPENTVTIPANAAGDPVYAVLYADVYGNTGYILGTPAASPSVPLVDPSTQLALTTVYIPAAGTEPGTDPGGIGSDPEDEIIYDENIEWATAKTEGPGITVDFDAVSDPAQNAKHITMITGAGTSALERLPLEIEENITPGTGGIGVVAETSTWSIALTNFVSGNKVDYTRDGIRHLIWYTVKNKGSLKAKLVNKDTLTEYPSSCYEITYVTFEVAELGFSVQVPSLLRFRSRAVLPIGDYKVYIEPGGIDRYEQKYSINDTAEVITPQGSLISFTRAESISAGDASILFSLKSSVPWKESTGLLFELYKGLNLVGAFPFTPGNYHGFDPGLEEYQRISLALSEFNLSAPDFDKLVIKPVNSWPAAATLKIDNIVLQSGIETPEQIPVSIGDWVEDQALEFRDIEAGGEYILDISASYDYQIIEAIFKADAGTITAKISINGTDITGLSAAAVDNTIQKFQPAALNQVKTNDLVLLTISALNGAAGLSGKIKTVRT